MNSIQVHAYRCCIVHCCEDGCRSQRSSIRDHKLSGVETGSVDSNGCAPGRIRDEHGVTVVCADHLSGVLRNQSGQ